MDPKETTIFNAVLIAAGIIGVIMIYFIISIIRQQRRNQKLHLEKIFAEINTLEKERSRMAADLHDELGPVLSSVKLKMNCLELSSKEDEQQLEKINANIDSITNRMREISNDLMPSVLARKGLVPAIGEFISRMTKPDELKIRLQADDINEFPKHKSIHIYRIIQELVHNAIKHSRATDLDIELRKKNNCLIITCRDNGAGFDQDEVSHKNAGLGLRNLLSRTEILGGEMFIDSHPKKGTVFSFEFPIT